MASDKNIMDTDMSLITGEGMDNINNGVVVEFPPNGIQQATTEEQIEEEPSSRSLALSFVRDMEDFIIASTASSSASTSTLGSSYVEVSAAAQAAAKSEPDDTFSESSSWSNVAFSSSASINTNENKFNVVCLDDSGSSSSYVLMCKRCTYHNPMNSEICEVCNFGGPNTTTTTLSDEQIALALQQAEEDGECSDHSGRVSFIRPYDFESISDIESSFVHEVTSFLTGLPSMGLKALLPDNLMDLASPFINAVTNSNGGRIKPKIALMYKAMPSDDHTLNTIRSNGFTPTVLGTCSEFSDNVDAAFALAFVASTKKRSTAAWGSSKNRRKQRGFGRLPDDRSSASRALCPILEEKDQDSYSKFCCWIVATVRFEGDGTDEHVVQAPSSGLATTWNLGHPELAVPLVNFHSKLRHTDMVRVLRNGLSQIMYDHFENETNLEGIKKAMMMAGRDSNKKPKLSGNDDEQIKGFHKNFTDDMESMITHKTAE